MDVNDNCRNLITGEKEKRFSSICTKTARKSSTQTAFRCVSCTVMTTLPLFQVRFINPISLSHCSACLGTPDSLPILGAHTEIILLWHFLCQYFLHFEFVSSDFLRYACYLVVFSVQIIPVIALPIILNFSMCFSFILEKDRP